MVSHRCTNVHAVPEHPSKQMQSYNLIVMTTVHIKTIVACNQCIHNYHIILVSHQCAYVYGSQDFSCDRIITCVSLHLDQADEDLGSLDLGRSLSAL